MNYVYPKLSNIDLGIVRVGGAGLGNILFTYARAIVFARDNGLRVIWPTWPSLKIGPVLRHEKDKRFYHDLFSNNSKYIDGIEKAFKLLFSKRLCEDSIFDIYGIDSTIIEFTGFQGCFDTILHDHKYVYQDIIRNLKPKNRKALDFDFGQAIGIHIRLGDFRRGSIADVKKGLHDCSIPIEWYISMVRQVRDIVGKEVKVYIFSDGTDSELKRLLDISNTERISFQSSIADILALSRAPLFIASGSSFSMWVRYFGRMSTIMHINQSKQKILTEDDSSYEIEVEDEIDPLYNDAIRLIFE